MRVVGRATLVVAALIVGLGAVEALLRAFVPAMAAGSAARFELDRDLIYRLRPANVVAWSSPEFTEVSHVNARGLRGAALAPKGPATRRILAVGDSFTFGHGVQDDEAYPAVAERLLRAHGHDVQVLNAGVPGYNTDQAYGWTLRDGLALAPDLLLVGVHCSDVSDNYESSLYDVVDGRLVRRATTATRMYRLGAIVNVIPPVVRTSRTFDVLVASFDWHDAPSVRPAVADLDAWSFAKMRLAIGDLATRVPAIATVLMPCKKALAGGPDPYGTLAHDLRAAGVPVMDGMRAFHDAVPDPAALFFHDDPHLNAEGNRVLASTVAAFVEEVALLAPPAAVVAVSAPTR